MPVSDLEVLADDARAYLLEQRRQHALATLADKIPPRFAASIDLPSEVEAWLEEPVGGLYLTGPVGVGKTHAAWEVLRRWVNARGGSVVAHRATTLLDELRPDDRTSAKAEVRRCQQAGVLMVDDLGAEKPSDWTQERLYEVVDERYVRCRPVVVTSNVPPRALAEHVGERVASRLAAMCTVVALVGSDRRRS